jgi:hypothetical protein
LRGSGGLPNPAAGAPGGHRNQPSDQRQDRGQPTDRRDQQTSLPYQERARYVTQRRSVYRNDAQT